MKHLNIKSKEGLVWQGYIEVYKNIIKIYKTSPRWSNIHFFYQSLRKLKSILLNLKPRLIRDSVVGYDRLRFKP